MSNDDYLSKSRLKTWVNCPRKFYYDYVEEIETPETESMVRGTDIHELIEDYYENTLEFSESNKTVPTPLYSLLDLPESENEDDDNYLHPYLSNFLKFERRRWERTQKMDDWKPIGIEKGEYRKVFQGLPNLTGYADALLPAASFSNSDVAENNGCVLIDFKTGEPKSEEYQSHENAGVFLDLAYYYLLFESEFDIVSVGGYYPKEDVLVVNKVSEEQEKFIKEIATRISDADEDNIDDYPIKPGPLCAWDEGEGNRCEYYDMCDSTWAEPIDNKEEVVDLIRSGKSDDEIAKEIGTTVESVRYWVHKKKWHRYRS